MRLQAKIRDTGLHNPAEETPTRTRVNSGSWVELYANRITYDQGARLGEASEHYLESTLTGPHRYSDVTFDGVNNPTIMISGSVDTDLEASKQHLKFLFEMLKTQGVKEIEGDFLSYVDNGPFYVRIRNITLNPPVYGSGVNKVSYQMNLVRVS
jgi:hypothetical protein